MGPRTMPVGGGCGCGRGGNDGAGYQSTGAEQR